MKIIGLNIQTAFFAPGLVLSDKLIQSSEIIKETGSLFNGDPIILPIPNEAPAEFPRIILKSKDGRYILEIKSSRIDFIVKDEKNDKSQKNYPALFIKDYQSKLQSVSLAINNIFKAKIVRLGYVLSLQFKVDDAVEIVKKSYIKKIKFIEDTFDFNIGFLNKIVLNNLETNIWFRANALRSLEKEKDNKVLLVIFDTNTVPEKILDLTQQDITSFTQATNEYIDKNLKNYLPEYDERLNS